MGDQLSDQRLTQPSLGVGPGKQPQARMGEEFDVNKLFSGPHADNM